MLAEQVEDERDARVLFGFGIEDIEPESLRIYRQMLRDEKPSHPDLEQDDFERPEAKAKLRWVDAWA